MKKVYVLLVFHIMFHLFMMFQVKKLQRACLRNPVKVMIVFLILVSFVHSSCHGL